MANSLFNDRLVDEDLHLTVRHSILDRTPKTLVMRSLGDAVTTRYTT